MLIFVAVSLLGFAVITKKSRKVEHHENNWKCENNHNDFWDSFSWKDLPTFHVGSVIDIYEVIPATMLVTLIFHERFRSKRLFSS